MAYYRAKLVDRDALCPINVLFLDKPRTYISTCLIFPNTGQTSVLDPYKLTFFYLLTNFGPISLSILFFMPPMLQISVF